MSESRKGWSEKIQVRTGAEVVGLMYAESSTDLALSTGDRGASPSSSEEETSESSLRIERDSKVTEFEVGLLDQNKKVRFLCSNEEKRIQILHRIVVEPAIANGAHNVGKLCSTRLLHEC